MPPSCSWLQTCKQDRRRLGTTWPKIHSVSLPFSFKKGARHGSLHPSCRHTACMCYEGPRGWEPISRMEELCLHITSPGGPGWAQFRRLGPCALQTWGGRQAHCLRQPGRGRVSPPLYHPGRPEGPGPVPAGGQARSLWSRGLPLTLAAQPCIGPCPLGSSRPQLQNPSARGGRALEGPARSIVGGPARGQAPHTPCSWCTGSLLKPSQRECAAEPPGDREGLSTELQPPSARRTPPTRSSSHPPARRTPPTHSWGHFESPAARTGGAVQAHPPPC